MKTIQILSNWKKSILIISLIPIIQLFITYTFYGPVYDIVLSKNTTLLEFFRLPYQLHNFDLLKNELPSIVRLLGQTSIFFLIILFVVWYFLFALGSYLQLYRQTAIKLDLVIELLIIASIYHFIIFPINVYIYNLGYIILAANFILILVYWIYDFKTKR